MTFRLKPIILSSLLSITALSQLSYAQDNGSGDDDNSDVTTSARAFWEAEVPGGNYMVALTSISSVSIHSYLVNQSFLVHEVNVVTRGQGLVRFYAYEITGENGASSVAKNIAEKGKDLLSHGSGRAGADANTTVEKEYGVNTHAGTIEYKLMDKDDLDQLHASIKRALRDNRGRKFTIR